MTFVPSIPYALSIVGGPELYPPPEDVAGFPTLEDVHSYPVMFSWEDLKDIIRTRLVLLQTIYDSSSRNRLAEDGGKEADQVTSMVSSDLNEG